MDYLTKIDQISLLRTQWSEHRDSAIQHLSACSNAVQEITYLAGTAQEQFESNWEVFDDDNLSTNNLSSSDTETETETETDNNSNYNPLARATARARATCRRTRDKEHHKLQQTLQQMTDVVSQMDMIYKTTQNEYVLLMTQDQNWSIKKIGLTWCCKDLIQVMQDIVDTYRTELFLKACIVDDVQKQTEIDILLAYVATFLAEPYVDDNVIFASLEAAKYDLSNKKVGKV